MEIKTISVTETRNWRQVRKEAQDVGALEVQNNGQPDLYILTPDVWEYLKGRGILEAYEQLKLERVQAKIARALEQSERGEISNASPQDILDQVKAKRAERERNEEL